MKKPLLSLCHGGGEGYYCRCQAQRAGCQAPVEVIDGIPLLKLLGGLSDEAIAKINGAPTLSPTPTLNPNPYPYPYPYSLPLTLTTTLTPNPYPYS